MRTIIRRIFRRDRATTPIHVHQHVDDHELVRRLLSDPGQAGAMMRRAAGLPSAPVRTRPRPDHATRFRPGQSGNPRGRRKGVGNDVMEARHIAERMYQGLNRFGLAMDCRGGLRDDKPEMLALVDAIRRGRVLGKREKGKGEGE